MIEAEKKPVKARDRKRGSGKHLKYDEQAVRTRLLKLEDDWLSTRMLGEAESTERLLDDSFLGTNSDGMLQQKSDFVEFVRSPRGHHEFAGHSERHIRLQGDTAISSGRVTLRTGERAYSYRYIRVYLTKQSEWHLVASQSTRIDNS